MRQMVAAGNVMNSAAHRSGCKERIIIGNIKKNKGEESKDDLQDQRSTGREESGTTLGCYTLAEKGCRSVHAAGDGMMRASTLAEKSRDEGCTRTHHA